MFSLSISQPSNPNARQGRFAERLVGKTLGFVGGLVLIAAIDALFWNSMLWRALAERVLPGDPTLLHAVGRIGATVLGH